MACSAKPNSSRSDPRRNCVARAGAKDSKALTLVVATSSPQASSVQPSADPSSPPEPGSTSGIASSAGEDAWPDFSAARTRSSSSSTAVMERVTTPARVPSGPSKVAITVTDRELDWPLVLSEFAAHRRLVSVCSDTTTTQPSAPDEARACSISSWGAATVTDRLRVVC